MPAIGQDTAVFGMPAVSEEVLLSDSQGPAVRGCAESLGRAASSETNGRVSVSRGDSHQQAHKGRQRIPGKCRTSERDSRG